MAITFIDISIPLCHACPISSMVPFWWLIMLVNRVFTSWCWPSLLRLPSLGGHHLISMPLLLLLSVVLWQWFHIYQVLDVISFGDFTVPSRQVLHNFWLLREMSQILGIHHVLCGSSVLDAQMGDVSLSVVLEGRSKLTLTSSPLNIPSLLLTGS